MKPNIRRKRNYLFEALGILEILAIYLIWFFILHAAKEAVIAAALTYYPLAWLLRLTLQRHHRSGMRNMKNENFEEALLCFQKSEQFFTRYKWIDRHRYITMFASSAYSYLEMALQNQAYCLIQLNRISEAGEALEKLLAIAPDREDIAHLLREIQGAEKLQKDL
ncbi:MAG: hypothetical protein IJB99_00275 [Clostridia bacterium]|nr:hypothetical protein [Clostridia bacterium]